MSTPNEENPDLKGNYEFREVPLFGISDDSADKHTFDLMTLLLGCLLFRLGGQQVFAIQEIDDIRAEIGRVRIVLDVKDRIILTVKPVDTEDGN